MGDLTTNFSGAGELWPRGAKVPGAHQANLKHHAMLLEELRARVNKKTKGGLRVTDGWRNACGGSQHCYGRAADVCDPTETLTGVDLFLEAAQIEGFGAIGLYADANGPETLKGQFIHTDHRPRAHGALMVWYSPSKGVYKPLPEKYCQKLLKLGVSFYQGY